MDKKYGFLETVASYRYMFQFLWKHKIRYAVGILLLSSCGLIETIFTGKLYQAITSFSVSGNTFSGSLLPLVSLALIMVTAVVLGNFLYTHSTAFGDLHLRQILIARLVRMPLSIWGTRQSADWFSVFGKDTDDAVESYKARTVELLSYTVQAVIGFLILAAGNPSLAICAAGIGLFYMGTGQLRRKRMRVCAAGQRQHGASISNQMQNMIEGSLTARFFDLDAVLMKKLSDSLQENYRCGCSGARILFFNAMLGQIGYMLAYTGTLLFGMWLVSRNVLSLNKMVSIWPIAVGVAYAIQKMGYFLTTYQITAAAIERVREIMELPSEDNCGTEELAKRDLEIEYRDVSFSYPNGKTVLSHVSFTIKQGERVAFVGESGSGKTTLMKLLFRFYEPDSGEILINNIPIKKLTLENLRGKFSYVPQTPHLLDDTIYNNIAIVKREASDYEVILSAEKSYSSEFIERMNLQYNTSVGENGSSLSGGQRQRIAIARALIKNSSAVIFDEVTSALDNESEQKINIALNNMDEHCTLLMITHKLTSARNCNRIIVLNNGEICEMGSHDDLISQKGFYANLWKKQR